MSARKIVVALLIIVVAIGGFVAGLVLLQQRQEIREEASVPGGQATVSINPSTGSFDVGDTIEAAVSFNTANIAVSGVAVRLSYPFSGATPEVAVTSIEVNPTLLSSGDWTCPTQSTTQQGGNVLIDIGCANTSSAGFSNNSNTELATITFQVNRAPTTTPVVVRFDAASSVITRRSDNSDILLIPASTGSYSVGGASSTSPTVTSVVSPTATPRLTATATVSASPTSTVSGSPTPTRTATPTQAQLPGAGVSYPVYFGLGLGILVIVGAVLLAL